MRHSKDRSSDGIEFDGEFGVDSAADQTKPFGAIAKVKARWFWACWPSRRACYDGLDPASYGVEDSLDAAITRCGGRQMFANELDWLLDSSNVKFNAWAATEWRSVLAKRRRKPNLKASPDLQPTDYIYHYSNWDDEGEFVGFHRHRILKKTAKRIFVDRSCFRQVDLPALSLDRSQLEAGEVIRPYRILGEGGFCLSAPEENESECFAALGLKSSPIPTPGKVTRAYRRLAKKHHPDCGGDPNGFRYLNEQYEKALALAKAFHSGGLAEPPHICG